VLDHFLDMRFRPLRVPHVEHVSDLSYEQMKPRVCEKLAQTKFLTEKYLSFMLEFFFRDLLFSIFERFVCEVVCCTVKLVLPIKLFKHRKLLWRTVIDPFLEFYFFVKVITVLADFTKFLWPKDHLVHTVLKLFSFFLILEF
jgi:hypothetical protein